MVQAKGHERGTTTVDNADKTAFDPYRSRDGLSP
jgi:hypothetical protein